MRDILTAFSQHIGAFGNAVFIEIFDRSFAEIFPEYRAAGTSAYHAGFGDILQSYLFGVSLLDITDHAADGFKPASVGLSADFSSLEMLIEKSAQLINAAHDVKSAAVIRPFGTAAYRFGERYHAAFRGYILVEYAVRRGTVSRDLVKKYAADALIQQRRVKYQADKFAVARLFPPVVMQLT